MQQHNFFKLFSWQRLYALIIKEICQLKRDYTTFAMIIMIPVIQILMFGYAINNDPKHLPTVILSSDNSDFVRTYVTGLKNTGYFQIIESVKDENTAEKMLAVGDAHFIINIPSDFTQQLIRGRHPAILLEADGTDPTAITNAVAAANTITLTIFKHLLVGSLSSLENKPPPFELRTHIKYNPSGITQYNVVPGLIGVILTMTLVMVTAMAITRERERGTMENLLATPAKPLEVMIGKTLPYIVVGYLQATIILVAARFLFAVPMQGSLLLLMLLMLPFIFANLLVGITFSTVANTQLQASQMAVFFFLPSIMLSGFMFPFRGMPEWAQWLGQLLPMTHFINITRSILLKGNGFIYVWPDVWPILLFILAVVFIGVKRYRQTLD